MAQRHQASNPEPSGLTGEQRAEMLTEFVKYFVTGNRNDKVSLVLASLSGDIKKKFIRKKKEDCNHRKGCILVDSKAPKGPREDYAVSDHTFSDGHREIRCTICGKMWTVNHPEWRYALYMVNTTSNSRSSSEIGYEGNTKEVFDNLRNR